MKSRKQGRVRIVADPCPSNPRTDCDTGTRLALFSRRRGLWGDKDLHPKDAPEGALPVYIYEHGGIALSLEPFSCPWDSGHAGYIWLAEDHGYDLTKITPEEICKNALKEFEQYLTGEVYGFVVEEREVMENPKPGGPLLATPWKHVDSCYGFFGDDHRASGLVDHLPKWAIDNELWIDRSSETGHNDGITLPDE